MNGLPDFRHLPAPLPVVTVLHLVTLTLHLLAMNAMVGTLFFLAFLRGRSAARSAASESLARLVPTLVLAASCTHLGDLPPGGAARSLVEL